MKKIFLPLLIASIALASAFADDRGRDFPGPGPFGPGRGDDRQCFEVRRELDNVSAQLNRCIQDSRRGGGDRRFQDPRIDQLQRDNQALQQRNNDLTAQLINAGTDNSNLRSQNQDLSTQISALRYQNDQLKITVAQLQDQINPRNIFDLAAAIRACGGINNAVYAQQCTTAAKQYSVDASVINQCAKIQNAYYALNCVQTAGQKGVNARQVGACLLIKNDVYASQCVGAAGDKKVDAEVIASCVASSDNAYYQLQCVSN